MKDNSSSNSSGSGATVEPLTVCAYSVMQELMPVPPVDLLEKWHKLCVMKRRRLGRNQHYFAPLHTTRMSERARLELALHAAHPFWLPAQLDHPRPHLLDVLLILDPPFQDSISSCNNLCHLSRAQLVGVGLRRQVLQGLGGGRRSNGRGSGQALSRGCAEMYWRQLTATWGNAVMSVSHTCRGRVQICRHFPACAPAPTLAFQSAGSSMMVRGST